MQVNEFPVATIHGRSFRRSETLPQESLDCLGPTLALQRSRVHGCHDSAFECDRCLQFHTVIILNQACRTASRDVPRRLLRSPTRPRIVVVSGPRNRAILAGKCRCPGFERAAATDEVRGRICRRLTRSPRSSWAARQASQFMGLGRCGREQPMVETPIASGASTRISREPAREDQEHDDETGHRLAQADDRVVLNKDSGPGENGQEHIA